MKSQGIWIWILSGNPEPGSNQKMTDKHAAEYTKAVCWDVN